MGKNVDLTVVQKIIHKDSKPQKVTAERAGCTDCCIEVYSWKVEWIGIVCKHAQTRMTEDCQARPSQEFRRTLKLYWSQWIKSHHVHMFSGNMLAFLMPRHS